MTSLIDDVNAAGELERLHLAIESSSQVDGQFTSDFGSMDDDDSIPDDEAHMADEDEDYDGDTRTWLKAVDEEVHFR